jgi:hypothetical protein
VAWSDRRSPNNNNKNISEFVFNIAQLFFVQKAHRWMTLIIMRPRAKNPLNPHNYESPGTCGVARLRRLLRIWYIYMSGYREQILLDFSARALYTTLRLPADKSGRHSDSVLDGRQLAKKILERSGVHC